MPTRPTLPPNTSPGGRGVNPSTGRIGDMPGGRDYLAGLGPAPAGLSAADMWAPAPVIHATGHFAGPIGSEASKVIRQVAPHGFGNLFNAFNALGYKPPTPQSPLNQWYQNGMWGGPTPTGNVYNGAGIGGGPAPITNPAQAAIAAATQTSFAPTGSQNPAVNTALMASNPVASPAPTTPGISWGGGGGPYSQMNQNYKQMTAGLTPAQILAMFKP